MAFKGIDTSEHQNSLVDYAKAKEAGYDFAILRIGYNTRLDRCFEHDYKKAKESGLKVGVYFYTVSTGEHGAKNDALRVVEWLTGKKLDLPVVYDMEEKAMNNPGRKTANSAQYNAWSQVLSRHGYKSMLYTGEYMFNSCFDKSAITDPVWIAKYSSKAPNIGRDVALWQYTSNAIASDFYTKNLDRSYLYDESLLGAPVKAPEVKQEVPAKVEEVEEVEEVEDTEMTTIKKGSKGTAVKLWQVIVGTTIDGDFGTKTADKTKAFQKAHNLTVDGIVGANTWKAGLRSI